MKIFLERLPVTRLPLLLNRSRPASLPRATRGSSCPPGEIALQKRRCPAGLGLSEWFFVSFVIVRYFLCICFFFWVMQTYRIL